MKKIPFLLMFTKTEITLWISSVSLITISFLAFDRANYLSFIASLLGATSLIFNAKGNPTGLVIMIIFSSIYGYISYTFAYYGEMFTYVCMTLPMSAFALYSWLKNPYNNNKSEVKIRRITKKDVIFIIPTAIVATFVFYFILNFFNTANIIPSTFSVTTSFIAVFLTYKRSPYFALAYAVNDIVLIVLWTLATIENISYVSVLVCFIVFLVNDLYSFINWRRMEKRQSKSYNSSK